MITIGKHFTLDEQDIELSFVRASGPGGQHVNKVSTAVQLRYPLHKAPRQDPEFIARVERLAGRRLTADGVLVIESRAHRSQSRNRQEALAKLVALFERALRKPAKRRPTRKTRASHEKRLSEKKRRQTVKRGRRRPTGEE